MAVLSQIPGIDVSVHVNGSPAKEYPPPDHHHDHGPSNPSFRTHECYIESQSAQTYTVEVSIAPNCRLAATKDLTCRLSVDGLYIDGKVLRKHKSSNFRRYSFIGPLALSATTRKVIREKLTFSPVTTVEQTSKTTLERDAKIVASLGAIVLTISTCKAMQEGEFQTLRQQTRQEETFTIAEKSMKGKELSHGTTFSKGDVVSDLRRQVIVCDETLIAKYIFCYRSRSALQKEMVIPQAAATQGPSFSDEIQSMTENEVRSLAEKLLRAKREQNVKSENGSPRLKRNIDLTDDDVVEVSGHGKVKIMKLEDGCDAVDLT